MKMLGETLSLLIIIILLMFVLMPDADLPEDLNKYSGWVVVNRPANLGVIGITNGDKYKQVLCSDLVINGVAIGDTLRVHPVPPK